MPKSSSSTLGSATSGSSGRLAVRGHVTQMRGAEIQGHLGQLGAERGQGCPHFDLRRQDQPGQGNCPQNFHAGDIAVASRVPIQGLLMIGYHEFAAPLLRDRRAWRYVSGRTTPNRPGAWPMSSGDSGSAATRSIGKAAGIAASPGSLAAGRNWTIFPKSGRLARLNRSPHRVSNGRPAATFSAIAPNPALSNCRQQKLSADWL